MKGISAIVSCTALALVLVACASGHGQEASTASSSLEVSTSASLASGDSSTSASASEDLEPDAANASSAVSEDASSATVGLPDASQSPVESQDQEAAGANTVNKTDAANTLLIATGTTTLEAALEDNVATAELMALLQEGPIVLDLHEYGGFEMIGSLPQSLPTADEQMSTTTGDIVLYQGSQISFFYGSNSWSYTRLGHIDGYDSAALLEALGGPGDSTVELSLQE